MKSYKYKYTIKNLSEDEKIISRLKTSNIVYLCILALIAISIILLPRTILEFFWKDNTSYLPILIINLAIFFLAIYVSMYFASRRIYLTDKRIFGKWGIFKIKFIDTPLNQIETIDVHEMKAIEIELSDGIIKFDYVANPEDFRLATVNQIRYLIDSIDNENTLNTFSKPSTPGKEKHSNMIECKCCGGMISRESAFCVHCGQPYKKHHQFIKQCLLILTITLVIILSFYLSISSVLKII